MTRAELLSPEACMDCHPRHYREWSGSMHAYAADDPVFLAMNARGQEETAGELGDFCVQCHAPMAVREGATTDGLNLASVPQELKGVTCFFCHNVDAVEGEHNNPLRLANDNAMRGALRDGAESGAHDQRYSPLHDRQSQESSKLCGACHDIVTPAGIHLERTYSEWQDSFFSRSHDQGGLSCGNCHMPGQPGEVIADVEGVGVREFHEHTFPGIDVALTPWPEKDAQLAGIFRDLEPAVLATLCWTPVDGGKVQVTLDNIGAGHMMPSGAAPDRRMWVQLEASRGDALALVSGAVAPGQPVSAAAQLDPLLWQIRDFTRKADGSEAHMFWDVRQVDSQLLKPLVTADPSDPNFIHSTTREYLLPGAQPDVIDMVVHVRPIGLDILDDLISTGHLSPDVRPLIPTFTLESTRLRWTPATAGPDLCVSPGD